MVEHTELMELVTNIRNNVNYEENYRLLFEKLDKIIKWFSRKYLTIVFRYHLQFEDLQQEMSIGVVKAVQKIPLNCKNSIDWFMIYLRGSCLNYFKYNTNRIMKHSEDKEKRLLEHKETMSIDKQLVEDGSTLLDLIPVTEYGYNTILEFEYQSYIKQKIFDFCYKNLKGFNHNLFKDFFELSHYDLLKKYPYEYKNILQYVNFIILYLKTSKEFEEYCYKYLYDVLIDRPFNKFQYTNHMKNIDLTRLLNEDIKTEYTGKKATRFQYGVDCAFLSYFRCNFRKNLLTIDK